MVSWMKDKGSVMGNVCAVTRNEGNIIICIVSTIMAIEIPC